MSNFTARAFVCIEDKTDRNKVIQQIKDLGYQYENRQEDALVLIEQGIIRYSYHAETVHMDFKGCGKDMELFLELAKMRSDTDENQWFICIRTYTDPYMDYSIVDEGDMLKWGSFDRGLRQYYRLATPQEIIDNKKQEKL